MVSPSRIRDRSLITGSGATKLEEGGKREGLPLQKGGGGKQKKF